MRIWSLHPSLLDAKGLVALWRETLLAKAVLEGLTRGYRSHPQLDRFRGAANPLGAIHAYLAEVWAEADRRGYHFDPSKIGSPRSRKGSIPVTTGQVAYEMEHLLAKLRVRDPERYVLLLDSEPLIHPLFVLRPGEVEFWEKGKK
jgi:hypothetical protein